MQRGVINTAILAVIAITGRFPVRLRLKVGSPTSFDKDSSVFGHGVQGKLPTLVSIAVLFLVNQSLWLGSYTINLINQNKGLRSLAMMSFEEAVQPVWKPS